ncbi:uncharacterized protein TNCV_3238301 [Trichonephila clavipes]|nr:uncharacterized protein TNCV_3238301 [Trichonephila clavipes]
MACERKLLESKATTGVFVLLGEQGNKAVLDWVMKEGLIPSKYESPKCKKDMRLVERKGTIDGFEWCCRVQSKENPHFACRSRVPCLHLVAGKKSRSENNRKIESDRVTLSDSDRGELRFRRTLIRESRREASIYLLR